MKPSFFSKTLSTLLIAILITPSASLIASQKVHAQLTTTLPQGFTPTTLDSTLNLTSGGASSLSVPGTELTTSASQFGSGLPGASGAGCLASTPAAIAALAPAGLPTSDSVLKSINTFSAGVNLSNCVTAAISLITQTITQVAAVTSSAALVALQIDAYVLQPLAFVLSGKLLKLITEGVIQFVIGKANGTGIPQFVADIQTSLQTVSDVHTLAYLDQYMRSSRSPYSGSIVSALRKDYLNKTSLAGFWAANMDTLRKTSPNPYGYLNGNWALGGVDAWFALTTQIQNNPYALYQNSQNQLAAIIGPGVGGATGARIQDVSNGQGFVSWCGESNSMLGAITTNDAAGANAAAVDASATAAYDFAYNKAIADGQNADAIASAAYDVAYKAAIASGKLDFEATQAAVAASRAARAAALSNAANAVALANAAAASAKSDALGRAKAANAGNSFLGIAPGDPCTNADGTTGTIKTPGSVIVAGLNKVLGGQQDSVVRMGNVGPEITNILSNIATVLKTVDFAAKILGGPGSGGLFGVNQSSGSNAISPLRQYTDSPGNLGVTNANIAATAAALSTSGPDMLNRLAQYEPAVNTLRSAANTASTNITALVDFCIAQQAIASSTLTNGNPTDLTNLTNFTNTSTAQINAAQNALATEVTPTLAWATTASTTITAARAMVQKVQTELQTGAGVSDATYIADVQTLGTMPPTPSDVASAQKHAFTTGVQTAIANPSGSLNVSGNILVDRLTLISTNATALKGSVCTAPAPTPLVPPTPPL